MLTVGIPAYVWIVVNAHLRNNMFHLLYRFPCDYFYVQVRVGGSLKAGIYLIRAMGHIKEKSP